MNAPIALAALALLCSLCRSAAADEAGDAPAPRGRAAEPKVQHTVIEDEGSRIEELRVRGRTQRITVTPKVGVKQDYEVVPTDDGRDMSDNAAGSRGAGGKRVWRVLTF